MTECLSLSLSLNNRFYESNVIKLRYNSYCTISANQSRVTSCVYPSVSVSLSVCASLCVCVCVRASERFAIECDNNIRRLGRTR